MQSLNTWFEFEVLGVVGSYSILCTCLNQIIEVNNRTITLYFKCRIVNFAHSLCWKVIVQRSTCIQSIIDCSLEISLLNSSEKKTFVSSPDNIELWCLNMFCKREMIYATVHKHAENDQLQQKQQHPTTTTTQS